MARRRMTTAEARKVLEGAFGGPVEVVGSELRRVGGTVPVMRAEVSESFYCCGLAEMGNITFSTQRSQIVLAAFVTLICDRLADGYGAVFCTHVPSQQQRAALTRAGFTHSRFKNPNTGNWVTISTRVLGGGA